MKILAGFRLYLSQQSPKGKSVMVLCAFPCKLFETYLGLAKLPAGREIKIVTSPSNCKILGCPGVD